MSVKPIRFIADEVRATLDGRKTTKRLVVSPANVKKATGEGYRQGHGLWIDLSADNGDRQGHIKDYSVSPLWATLGWYVNRYAPYRPGDVLWVRETWNRGYIMPREAARIWLRVTDVGVERLQEIDEDGAIAEGCSAGRFETTGGPWGVEDNPDEWTAREDFSHLWDSTVRNANRDRYGWDANPWVWVIEFERCEKPEEA